MGKVDYASSVSLVSQTNLYILNFRRNEFISNYHQGTLAFVDYYWRMIHRAAGWDALRFWLLVSAVVMGCKCVT